MRSLTPRTAGLIACETALLVGAVALAAWLRLGTWMWWETMANDQGVWKVLLVAFVAQVCLYYTDLYNVRLISDRRELFIRAVQALSASPAAGFQGKDAVYRACMIARHGEQPIYATDAIDDDFARQVLRDYQDYWWHALKTPTQRAALEAKLLSTLR